MVAEPCEGPPIYHRTGPPAHKTKAPPKRGRCKQFSRSDLHHGFLEVLRGPKGNLLAGLDLDGLARRWVATHARCALPHLQDAEARDADARTSLEMLT